MMPELLLLPLLLLLLPLPLPLPSVAQLLLPLLLPFFARQPPSMLWLLRLRVGALRQR